MIKICRKGCFDPHVKSLLADFHNHVSLLASGSDPNKTTAKKNSSLSDQFLYDEQVLPSALLFLARSPLRFRNLAILVNFVDIVFMVNILLNCTLKPWGSIGAFYSVERIGGFAPFS
jgi:hypothetical protein